ncbi:hypothetical protein N7499_007425 [Penicillium canescens]|uniref:Cytochrome b5 heme-binding domain-containing protein n=1 Tax=Penicillium canescens TaxID=5083 RepID=A0AAD6NBC5_PENCN|nr:uncharacterized protein N7446_003116 [Penicillium canescens]KAJ6044920.1 hypothetical protein N7460_006275 [Penicillium canescens]KAJ6056389.1 hypothetical protein N7444_005487 [Penicillium canescens]KAJ6075339.1 hypothetical protein N7446_003116 [Penicillium canescens]KAJ6082551.1 hypothetical protein N7499_007425 [Penicillium canescens]KAJ6175654.1 hypothetical protein N7485_002568 [Penicillium canescens]
MTITSAILGGLGITIGYHRLWAHRSFQACTAVKILLAVAGAAQSQWPILWWVRHHRAHHKYVDTDRDPYNANRGLWFTHIGWLLGKNEAAWGRVDVSDLEIDPVVIWQKRLYYPIVVVVGILLPTAVAHYGWNDWKGGMIYGGLGRIALSHHVTFMINSVAHASWAGSQPYSATTTARNVPLLALVSFGEGNHNFHHTFPTDYRNGIKWHEPDLSRLVIWTWAKLGLVSDLKTVSPLEIELAGQRQHVRRTEDGEKLTQLPRMIWHEYIKQVNRGRCWVSIDGMVYDVTDYMNDHPGGRDLIEGVIGKDATALYYGHHSHSPHAAAVLEDLRISLIRSD